MSEKVLYEKKGEIAYITFNRPEVKNAIDLDVHHRLRECGRIFAMTICSGSPSLPERETPSAPEQT